MSGAGKLAETRSVLLVEAPLLGNDLEAALIACGAEVATIAPSALGLEFLRAARERGCAALLSINHSPELALLCTLAMLPYVSWTIDPLPRKRWSLLPGTDPANARLFVHRQALVEPLRAMGHGEVAWMPLACASRRWTDPGPSPSVPGPPLFVGSSLQDERRMLREGLSGWGLEALLPPVDVLLGEIARASLWDRSFPGFARAPEAVPASLREALVDVDPLDVAEVLDAGLAWHFRRLLVGILADRGVEIKGDDGWREVAGDRWTGPLRNGREMTAAYAGAAVNLDVPRFHQREIATLRAFDAMGSGGLFAAEAGTELDALLAPGRQFLSWSDLAGLDDILERALARDPELARIAEAGAAAVRRDHSLEARAGTILGAIAG